MIGRRFFMFAAPAIVAAPALMRVSSRFLGEKGWDIDAMAAETERRIQDSFALQQMQTIQRIDADQRGIRYADYFKMMHGELRWT